MSRNNDKANLKPFFIKLIAITFSIIVVINITYNLIFEEKFQKINKILSLNNKESINLFKDKMRSEINKGLKKDKILNEEDKILLYKLYKKLREEFKDIEQN